MINGYDWIVIFLALLFIISLIYKKKQLNSESDLPLCILICFLLFTSLGDLVLMTKSFDVSMFCTHSCIDYNAHYIHPINWCIGLFKMMVNSIHITWV